MKTLKISLVATGAVNSADFEVQEILKKKFQALKDTVSNFPYSDLDFISFSFNDEPNLISKNTIAAVNPSRYLTCKEFLQDKIIPLLAVRKSNQTVPYYPAFFIANKYSAINSIRSKSIQRIYAVDDSSTSGYIAPIYKLWESGVIQYPNIQGIKEKGWELIFVGKHTEVENRVIEDELSLGITGQFSFQEEPDKLKIKPLLRYYYLPQDVLAISYDLAPYEKEIKQLLNDIFIKDKNGKFLNDEALCFGNSSNRICGFSDLNYEFQNALEELKIMMKHLDNYSTTKYFQELINELEKDQNKSIAVKQMNELKELLAINKENEVLDYLMENFDKTKDKSALNEVVMIEAAYNSINQRQRLGLFEEQQYTISIGRIRKSILDIIDFYIK